MKESIHQLKADELTQITDLYEKKLALENLVKIVDPNSANFDSIYTRLMSDYGKTVREFEAWWNRMKNTYKWPDGNYVINFEESCVALV